MSEGIAPLMSLGPVIFREERQGNGQVCGVKHKLRKGRDLQGQRVRCIQFRIKVEVKGVIKCQRQSKSHSPLLVICNLQTQQSEQCTSKGGGLSQLIESKAGHARHSAQVGAGVFNQGTSKVGSREGMASWWMQKMPSTGQRR